MSKPKEAPNPIPINTSGIQPVEYKVLIRLDPVKEQTESGLYLPEETQERGQAAETFATLIAVGGNAFEGWNEPIPKVGDRVLVDKYAGAPPKAGDFKNYHRLCNDKDLCAVLS